MNRTQVTLGDLQRSTFDVLIPRKQIVPKQSLGRRIFKSIFCFNSVCASKSPSIEDDRPKTLSNQRANSNFLNYSSTSLKNFTNDMDVFINLNLGRDGRKFTILPSTNYSEVFEKKQMNRFEPLILLKRKDAKNPNNVSTEDLVCDYITKKYLNEASYTLVSQVEPSMKLLEYSNQVSDYVLLEIVPQRGEEGQNIVDQTSQYIKSYYSSAENQSVKENQNDIVFCRNNRLKTRCTPDVYLICPQIESQSRGFHLTNEVIKKFILEKVMSIIDSNPDEIDKINLLLPGSLDMTTLQTIISQITTSYYKSTENGALIQRLQDPQSYRYFFKDKPPSPKKQSLKRPLSRLKIMGASGLSNQLESYMVFADCQFYIKLTGYYEKGILHYVMVQFRQRRGRSGANSSTSVLSREGIIQLSPKSKQSKFQVINEELKVFFMRRIFFADILFKSQQYTEDDYLFFDQLIQISSVASLSQSVYLIHSEHLDLISIQKEEHLLRYISIVAGSGIINEDQELQALQMILFRLGGIRPVDVVLRGPHLQMSEAQHITPIISSQKLNSLQSEVGGFSYEAIENNYSDNFDFDITDEQETGEMTFIFSDEPPIVLAQPPKKRNRPRIMTDMDVLKSQKDRTSHNLDIKGIKNIN